MTYLGSKVKYAKYIIPIIQQYIDDNTTFIDCCCGGCNIIKSIKAKKKIAIDKDKYLIALWKKMQEANFDFPTFPSKEEWDLAKEGKLDDWYVGLIKVFCSYFARGFAGGYDNREKSYTGRCNTARKDLPLIKDIEFINNDYSKILEYSNCVIYIDPPYKDTKKYDVSKSFDYDDFWNVVRKASEYNVVLISEQVAPNDFEAIWSLETYRMIGGVKHICTENLFKLK